MEVRTVRTKPKLKFAEDGNPPNMPPPSPLRFSAVRASSSSSLSYRFALLRRPIRTLRFTSSFARLLMDETPAVLPVKERIELSEKEDRIFTRLLDVVRHFGLETQLRAAGGWVRDKVGVSVSIFFRIETRN